MASTKIGLLFCDPYNKPLSTTGAPQPLCQRQFYVSGSGYVTQQPVYQDPLLQTPYAQPIIADANGRFSPIYLNPSLLYATQLFASNGITVLEQADPVNAQDISILESYVFSAAVQTLTNTTVLTNDAELTTTVPAAGTYQFEIDISWYGSGAVGLSFELAFTGSLNASSGQTYAGEGTYTGPSSFTINTPTSINDAGTPGGSNARLSGALQATSAGTLLIKWGPSSVSALAVNRSAGSSLYLVRLG